MESLDRHFGLRDMQRNPCAAEQRLWLFRRETAWRFIRRATMGTGVVGVAGFPRGLRHAFAVGALQAGVPLNVVQRWLGHARMSTTSIYADVSGPEEQEFAVRFWRTGRPRGLYAWIRHFHGAWSSVLASMGSFLRLGCTLKSHAMRG
jgi:integrase